MMKGQPCFSSGFRSILLGNMLCIILAWSMLFVNCIEFKYKWARFFQPLAPSKLWIMNNNYYYKAYNEGEGWNLLSKCRALINWLCSAELPTGNHFITPERRCKFFLHKSVQWLRHCWEDLYKNLKLCKEKKKESVFNCVCW